MLPARTHLWSLQRISSNEELATHWFRHYAALGIRMSTHAHIVVHATCAKETAHAHAFLRGQNVSHMTFVAAFSSAIKTKMLNEFISHELPRDAWLVYADADEFFRFPTDALKLARQSYALCSSMVDRLAAGFTVPRVRAYDARLPLALQFSLCARLRQRIAPSGGWMKITLLRARIRGLPPAFINTHVAVINLTRRVLRIGGNGRQRCTYTGGFPHYMHSEQGYAMLRSKLALYKQMRRAVSTRVYQAHLHLVEQVGKGRERFTPAAIRLIRNISVPCVT